jgi:16S rRNA (uracil1498-N3)-methyltransferase
MSRRRFFAPSDAFKQSSVTLTADEAKHLRGVLRLKPGDEVFVFNGIGQEFRCRVERFLRDEVVLNDCEQVDPAQPESPLNLTLALALLKGDKFDLVVQKATELGVSNILPVTTTHADIHLRDSSDAQKRVTRWQRIAMEAAKQCGRATVPDVAMPSSFDSVVTAEPQAIRLMFSERAGSPLEYEDSLVSRPKALIALIGSEGGWADDEIQHARSAGWHIVTLGGRILRAETAAISAMVLLQHHYGDLK